MRTWLAAPVLAAVASIVTLLAFSRGTMPSGRDEPPPSTAPLELEPEPPLQAEPQAEPRPLVTYHLERREDRSEELGTRFTSDQLALLEKVNRADIRYLKRLKTLVVPDPFGLDELTYSPLPGTYPEAEGLRKFIVVDQRLQVFGAYEYGRLVRWGPVSTGSRSAPTPSGVFHLKWKSKLRVSTANPDWILPFSFNFHSRRGISFHAYALPGYPASHACVRLLERDAKWLYRWGEQWSIAEDGSTIPESGTPVLIAGSYGYGKPAPWRSGEQLAARVELPNLAELEPLIAPAADQISSQ
jgi:lipoprotein-anchoring transpeptidase ErfK/SrfK